MKNKPAFPVGIADTPDTNGWLNEGMSLREYASIQAMKGLLANPEFYTLSTKANHGKGIERSKTYARWAVMQADALIKALGEQ